MDLSAVGRIEVLYHVPRHLGVFPHQVEQANLAHTRTPLQLLPCLTDKTYSHSDNILESRAAGIGWSREQDEVQAGRAEKRGQWEELLESRRAVEEEEKERLVQEHQELMIKELMVKRRADVASEHDRNAEEEAQTDNLVAAALEPAVTRRRPTMLRMRSILNSDQGRKKSTFASSQL
jgi:hypothetical protein